MVDIIILSVEVSKAVGNGVDGDIIYGKLLVLNESRCTFLFMSVDFCEDRNKCAGVHVLRVVCADIEVGGTENVSNKTYGIDMEERISV